MTNGQLEWNHPKGYINIPVSFVTTIDSLEKGDIHRVCTQCCKEVVDKKGKVTETEVALNTRVEQRFLCPVCEKVHNTRDPERKFIFKQKELPFKKDFARGIKPKQKEPVFLDAAEREYTKSKVKPTIHVEQEVSLTDVTTNAEFICGANKEIINNGDEYAPWVKKIHDYLVRNKKALLATFGENGKTRAGFIVATPRKLALLELYAGEQIREAVQLNLESLENPILAKLKAISENTSMPLYDEFIEKIMNGEEVVVEAKEEKVVPVLEATFLDA
jgi:hypothetical protein